MFPAMFVSPAVDLKNPFGDFLKFKGAYVIDHLREGHFFRRYRILNDITNEGKNLIFDVMFNGTTQIANNSWFHGLISLTSFSALAATDVMNSHSGWTEFTSYSQSNRVAWGSGAAASQSVTNSTPTTFDISSSGTVKGIFVTSNNTKGGTTGKLWSTALFNADVPVVNGDQLKVTYTLSA
jgi:hypothetical protein